MADHFKMRSLPDGGGSSQEELVRALTGSDAQEGLAVSRTRRNVHNTVINMEEQRSSRRKKAGLVFLVSLLFLTLLAPALWSSMDSFVAGGHFADLQTQTYLLGVMLFPGFVAAAIAGLTRQRNQNRRQS
jgi:hypothetical protein